MSEERKVKKIKVDRDVCIGAGPCVASAASVFELDDEQKAVMKMQGGGKEQTEADVGGLEDGAVTDDALIAAAQSCPVKAILLYGEDGEEIVS